MMRREGCIALCQPRNRQWATGKRQWAMSNEQQRQEAIGKKEEPISMYGKQQ